MTRKKKVRAGRTMAKPVSEQKLSNSDMGVAEPRGAALSADRGVPADSVGPVDQCDACEDLIQRLTLARGSAVGLSSKMEAQRREFEAEVFRRDAELKTLTLTLLDQKAAAAAFNEQAMTRQHERNLLANELAELDAAHAQQVRTIRDLSEQLDRFQASTSWKLTSPLRSIARVLRNAFK